MSDMTTLQPFPYPFSDTTCVQIPGTVHGRHTSNLLIQVWSTDYPPQTLNHMATIRIFPVTYDVTVTFEYLRLDPTTARLSLVTLPPQSGVVLIYAMA